jgi:hypothetical protein
MSAVATPAGAVPDPVDWQSIKPKLWPMVIPLAFDWSGAVRMPWMNVTKSSAGHTVGTLMAPIGSSKETSPPAMIASTINGCWITLPWIVWCLANG